MDTVMNEIVRKLKYTVFLFLVVWVTLTEIGIYARNRMCLNCGQRLLIAKIRVLSLDSSVGAPVGG